MRRRASTPPPCGSSRVPNGDRAIASRARLQCDRAGRALSRRGGVVRVAAVLSRARRAPAPLTVTQLTQLVRDTLATEFGSVLVAGEISNLRAPGSGHVYFTLKDERSQLRCVLFRDAAQLLVSTPADGQRVVVRGQISLYPARG